MEEKIQEEIERYLFQKMSQEELILFEDKMDSDPLLKEEVLLQLDVHRTFNDGSVRNDIHIDDTARKHQIKTELRSKELKDASDFIRRSTQNYKNKKSYSLRPVIKLVASIAAIILVVFAVRFNFFTGNTSLYDEYANWTDLPSLVEKSSDQNLLVALEKDYNSQNYTKVISAIPETTSDPYLLIYKGVSFFQLGNIERANSVFDELIATNSLESSRGYWYKLLITLKEKRLKDAKKLLDVILQDQNNYNYVKAKEIYSKLPTSENTD